MCKFNNSTTHKTYTCENEWKKLFQEKCQN